MTFNTAIPKEPSNENGATAYPAAGEAPADGSLLSRQTAADLLGVSLTTLRRFEKKTLHPVVDARGVHHIPEKQVAELLLQRRATAPASLETFDGVTAAQVFDLLDGGATASDIVRKLKIHPRAVAAIVEERARLNGGFTFSGEQAAQLDAFYWMGGEFPITSAEQLIRQLSGVNGRCVNCRRRVREVCGTCAHQLSVTAHQAREFEAHWAAKRKEAEQEASNWRRDVRLRRRGERDASEPTGTAGAKEDEEK